MKMLQLPHKIKGGTAMNKQDINTFIETMESIGDLWTPEQVEYVFGSMSLEDALNQRQSQIGQFVNIINTVLNK